MVGVEKQESLRYVRRLVESEDVDIDLWQNVRGDLFIAVQEARYDGKLVIATNEDLLMDFFSNELTIAALVERSPSPFARLIRDTSTITLYLPDAEPVLKTQALYYGQLSV